VKDLRRQITDFKADIIKLQDNAKSRDAELAESQRKVMELESLTQQQERRLGRLSELETKLQTLQMQSKSELGKKEAGFKRDMDAMRLQLVRFNQLENEVGTLAEALKRSTEREKSFRKDFTKQASTNPFIFLFSFKRERFAAGAG
jgi:chromosome segregation ATPase